MSTQASKNIRLGIMVLAATLSLAVAMYMIGDQRNLFGSTFSISAHFRNVDGLQVGNNVRFVGIDVGTVTAIEIINDSTVRVDMAIDSDSQKFIKKNAIATISNNGLMGNKLVNISSGNGIAPQVEDGDLLATTPPLDTDDALRTLMTTNETVSAIADNLEQFTASLNQPETVWSMLSDTTTITNIKSSMLNANVTSQYMALISMELSQIIADARSGKGIAGMLLTDTTLLTGLNNTIQSIRSVSDSMAHFSGDINAVSDLLVNSDGALQTILSDSLFDDHLQQTMINLANSSEDFEETMAALKHSFLLRHYYKKKERLKDKQRNQLD
jgi:phospholipid/cholesterol/gamma-HCH transport system substrate-binding protein